jgi:molybdopterin synthase catalytic subunit
MNFKKKMAYRSHCTDARTSAKRGAAFVFNGVVRHLDDQAAYRTKDAHASQFFRWLST